MAYFVTGATGFIGQFLVRNLLKRGAPIYVLVRKGSVKKLEALRESWGGAANVIPVIGDLAKPKLGVSDADMRSTSFENPVSRSTALMLKGAPWNSLVIDLSWTKCP